MEELTYDWTSNRFDTEHTLRVWKGSTLVLNMPYCDSLLLNDWIKTLEDCGFTHKIH